MGIEIRKGRTYYYDRKRVNGRRHCTYNGAIPAEGIELFRLQADVDLEKRGQARYEIEQAAKWADDVLAAGKEFNRLADGVFRDVMQSTGHTLHKRSEWRRTRGVSEMEKTEAIALAQKDPEWGNAARHALAGFLLLAAPKDDVLSDALVSEHRRYIAGLLAECSEPTMAERMAATRAAHNWLAVHILECKAALQPPTGPNALMLDKRVTLAEKRLHASLKSLAVLRRLRKPTVVKQVNIAKGPMVVNNGK